MRLLPVSIATGLALTCVHTGGAGEPPVGHSTPLAEAVKALNAKAAKDIIGKGQPPLTEQEVVASIRIWRGKRPASDEVFQVFQAIAETRRLPKGAKFRYFAVCTGHRGFNFVVWWVNLRIPTGERTGYSHRIRSRMISSCPVSMLPP